MLSNEVLELERWSCPNVHNHHNVGGDVDADADACVGAGASLHVSTEEAQWPLP